MNEEKVEPEVPPNQPPGSEDCSIKKEHVDLPANMAYTIQVRHLLLDALDANQGSSSPAERHLLESILTMLDTNLHVINESTNTFGESTETKQSRSSESDKANDMTTTNEISSLQTAMNSVNKGASHVESPRTSEGSVNVDMETAGKNSESTGNSLENSRVSLKDDEQLCNKTFSSREDFVRDETPSLTEVNKPESTLDTSETSEGSVKVDSPSFSEVNNPESTRDSLGNSRVSLEDDVEACNSNSSSCEIVQKAESPSFMESNLDAVEKHEGSVGVDMETRNMQSSSCEIKMPVYDYLLITSWSRSLESEKADDMATANEISPWTGLQTAMNSVNKGASHVESPRTSEGSVNVDMEATSKNSESTGNSLQSRLDAVEKPVEGSVDVVMDTSNTHSSSCEAQIPVDDYLLITSSSQSLESEKADDMVTANEISPWRGLQTAINSVNKGASDVDSPRTSEGSVNVDMEATSKNSESTGNSLQSRLDAVEKPVEGSVDVVMETSNTHSSSREAKIRVDDSSLITSSSLSLESEKADDMVTANEISPWRGLQTAMNSVNKGASDVESPRTSEGSVNVDMETASKNSESVGNSLENSRVSLKDDEEPYNKTFSNSEEVVKKVTPSLSAVNKSESTLDTLETSEGSVKVDIETARTKVSRCVEVLTVDSPSFNEVNTPESTRDSLGNSRVSLPDYVEACNNNSSSCEIVLKAESLSFNEVRNATSSLDAVEKPEGSVEVDMETSNTHSSSCEAKIPVYDYLLITSSSRSLESEKADDMATANEISPWRGLQTAINSVNKGASHVDSPRTSEGSVNVDMETASKNSESTENSLENSRVSLKDDEEPCNKISSEEIVKEETPSLSEVNKSESTLDTSETSEGSVKVDIETISTKVSRCVEVLTVDSPSFSEVNTPESTRDSLGNSRASLPDYVEACNNNSSSCEIVLKAESLSFNEVRNAKSSLDAVEKPEGSVEVYMDPSNTHSSSCDAKIPVDDYLLVTSSSQSLESEKADDNVTASEIRPWTGLQTVMNSVNKGASHVDSTRTSEGSVNVDMETVSNNSESTENSLENSRVSLKDDEQPRNKTFSNSEELVRDETPSLNEVNKPESTVTLDSSKTSEGLAGDDMERTNRKSSSCEEEISVETSNKTSSRYLENSTDESLSFGGVNQAESTLEVDRDPSRNTSSTSLSEVNTKNTRKRKQSAHEDGDTSSEEEPDEPLRKSRRLAMETTEPHVEAHEAKVKPENPCVADMGVSSVGTTSVSNEGSSQDEGYDNKCSISPGNLTLSLEDDVDPYNNNSYSCGTVVDAESPSLSDVNNAEFNLDALQTSKESIAFDMESPNTNSSRCEAEITVETEKSINALETSNGLKEVDMDPSSKTSSTSFSEVNISTSVVLSLGASTISLEDDMDPLNKKSSRSLEVLTVDSPSFSDVYKAEITEQSLGNSDVSLECGVETCNDNSFSCEECEKAEKLTLSEVRNAETDLDGLETSKRSAEVDMETNNKSSQDVEVFTVDFPSLSEGNNVDSVGYPLGNSRVSFETDVEVNKRSFSFEGVVKIESPSFSELNKAESLLEALETSEGSVESCKAAEQVCKGKTRKGKQSAHKGKTRKGKQSAHKGNTRKRKLSAHEGGDTFSEEEPHEPLRKSRRLAMETAVPHVEAHEAKVTPENSCVADMGVSSVGTTSISNEVSSQDEAHAAQEKLPKIKEEFPAVTTPETMGYVQYCLTNAYQLLFGGMPREQPVAVVAPQIKDQRPPDQSVTIQSQGGGEPSSQSNRARRKRVKRVWNGEAFVPEDQTREPETCNRKRRRRRKN